MYQNGVTSNGLDITLFWNKPWIVPFKERLNSLVLSLKSASGLVKNLLLEQTKISFRIFPTVDHGPQRVQKQFSSVVTSHLKSKHTFNALIISCLLSNCYFFFSFFGVWGTDGFLSRAAASPSKPRSKTASFSSFRRRSGRFCFNVDIDGAEADAFGFVLVLLHGQVTGIAALIEPTLHQSCRKSQNHSLKRHISSNSFNSLPQKRKKASSLFLTSEGIAPLKPCERFLRQ